MTSVTRGKENRPQGSRPLVGGIDARGTLKLLYGFIAGRRRPPGGTMSSLLGQMRDEEASEGMGEKQLRDEELLRVGDDTAGEPRAHGSARTRLASRILRAGIYHSSSSLSEKGTILTASNDFSRF
ncbi:MAG: hypothetical protein GX597_15125 [Anaerolineaceae bacterium]|nr:hypothetical protein [Anaerolineaceae bacterium]